MDTKQILLLIGAIAVLAVGGYLMWQKQKKIAEKKAGEAKANGWSYERDGGNLERKYRHLPFYDGESPDVKHVMRGEFRGRPIMLFNFFFKEEDYVRSGGTKRIQRNEDGDAIKRKVRRSYGVVVVQPSAELPRFELSARSRARKRRIEERGRTGEKVLGNLVGDVMGETMGRALLGKDHTGGEVQTGDAAFDETFEVRSTNPDAARAMLTTEARAWLMSSDDAKKYVVWSEGSELITWGTGTDTAIGKVKAGYLNDLLDQLPGGQTAGGWGPPPS